MTSFAFQKTMDSRSMEVELDQLTLDLNQSFIENHALNSVSEVLRGHTRANRSYATKQIRSYERWVRLSHKRLKPHIRTQRILQRLKTQNDWLQGALNRLRNDRNGRRNLLRARRVRILEQLRIRADKEFESRSDVAQRHEMRRAEYAAELEQNLCNHLDEVSRLEQELSRIKESQARTLDRMRAESTSVLERLERDQTFELQRKLQQVRESHAKCKDRKAREEQRFLETARRLQNMRGEPRKGQELMSRQAEAPEEIDIEDSDEDDV